MQKRFIIILAILVISGGLAFILPWIFAHQKTSIGPLKYETKNLSYSRAGSNNRGTYVVEGDYPAFTDGLPDAVEEKINTSLSVWATHSAMTMKRDLDDPHSDIWGDDDAYIPPAPYSYQSKSAVSADLPAIPFINVAFENYTYTGGAHGITSVKTFTFDSHTGDELSLKSLFSGNYLLALSELSLAEIKKVDPELTTFTFAEDGTLPDPQNFSAFMLKPDGFHLIFQNYQVAPYVAGEPEIVISYESLKDYLAPKYKDTLLNPGLKP